MNIVVLGLKNCDSCKKAKKEISAADREVALRDVRDDPLEEALLEQLWQQFGNDIINTRSATWRGLDEASRTLPALVLLRDYPALMKRPVLQIDDQFFLGWNAASKAAALS